jgi:hypothetical protein
MPLTTAHTGAFENGFYVGVVFAMLDGDRHVICRVTKAALEDRSAKNGRRQRAAETFCRFRSEIEAIASVQYDSGVEGPVVESEHLVPIRVRRPVTLRVSRPQ